MSDSMWSDSDDSTPKKKSPSTGSGSAESESVGKSIQEHNNNDDDDNFSIMSDVTQSTTRSVVMDFNDSATLAALPSFGLDTHPVVQTNSYQELPIPSNKYKVGKTFALLLRYCEDVVQKVTSGVAPEDVQEMIRRKIHDEKAYSIGSKLLDKTSEDATKWPDNQKSDEIEAQAMYDAVEHLSVTIILPNFYTFLIY